MIRYRAFLWAGRLAERLPLWLIYGLALLAAEVAFLVNGSARRVAMANMRHVLGEHASPAVVRRAARGCFHTAALYYCDLARTPRMRPARFFARNLTVHGYEHFARAVAAGRGVIMATIHYGSPEYVAQALRAKGITFLALVEPLHPPQLAALFHRYRSSHGHEFVPVDVTGIKRALRRLRQGGIVAVLVDRDIQHTGVEVPFFGAPARLPPGAVDLALHTGAALLPMISRRTGLDRFAVTVLPPLDLVRTGDPRADRRRNTARLIACFEPFLRADPSQWFVLEEPVWVSAPARPTARSAPPAAAADGRAGGHRPRSPARSRGRRFPGPGRRRRPR
jgi:lauroyl/myristoyl acyltransferase